LAPDKPPSLGKEHLPSCRLGLGDGLEAYILRVWQKRNAHGQSAEIAPAIRT
jgi:hypothetical protein